MTAVYERDFSSTSRDPLKTTLPVIGVYSEVCRLVYSDKHMLKYNYHPCQQGKLIDYTL